MSDTILNTIKKVIRENILSGGKGDKRQSIDFDPDQLKMGIEIEREHTTDPEIAKEIAIDHLSEDPHYYTHLKQMEKQHGRAR